MPSAVCPFLRTHRSGNPCAVTFVQARLTAPTASANVDICSDDLRRGRVERPTPEAFASQELRDREAARPPPGNRRPRSLIVNGSCHGRGVSHGAERERQMGAVGGLRSRLSRGSPTTSSGGRRSGDMPSPYSGRGRRLRDAGHWTDTNLLSATGTAGWGLDLRGAAQGGMAQTPTLSLPGGARPSLNQLMQAICGSGQFGAGAGIDV